MKTRIQLIAELRETRPNVNVQVIASHDNDYVWDGDGPAPKGFEAFILEVKTTTIDKGEMKEGSDHLGGCYARKVGNFNSPRSKHAYEIDGYFPQMLEQALDNMDNV